MESMFFFRVAQMILCFPVIHLLLHSEATNSSCCKSNTSTKPSNTLQAKKRSVRSRMSLVKLMQFLVNGGNNTTCGICQYTPHWATNNPINCLVSIECLKVGSLVAVFNWQFRAKTTKPECRHMFKTMP